MSSDKEKIVDKIGLGPLLDSMEPNQKKMAALFLGGLCLVLLMWFMTSDNGKDPRSVRAKTNRTLLTATDTRSIGIDSLNSRVKTLAQEKNKQDKEIERLKIELEEQKKRRGNDPSVTAQIGKLQSQLDLFENQMKQQGWTIEDIQKGDIQVLDKNIVLEDKVGAHSDLNKDENYYFRTAPEVLSDPAPAIGAPNGANGALEGGGLTIHRYTRIKTEDELKVVDSEVYIPSGTIMSGIMMNGLDAPTGRNARKDPFPVLVRIQKDAILPNEYRADVKECFAQLSGYGDLSSTRALLRGETISCITHNKEYIDVQFPAYAIGEDGKAGIRGRLVDKAWPLIKNTSVAGFFSGVAEAFSSSPVPVLQTGTPGSSVAYQSNFSKDAVQHGASKGVSNAFDRLGEFYMDIADQIYPVIEVDAMRQVDIVVSKGFYLKIKKRSKNKKA